MDRIVGGEKLVRAVGGCKDLTLLKALQGASAVYTGQTECECRGVWSFECASKPGMA